MEWNDLLYLGIIVVVGVLCFLWGEVCGSTKDIFTEPSVSKLEEKYLQQMTDPERLPIWDIVRYRNGKYDCVWSTGHTKRDADKRCKKLNNDYHKNYGTYVVEING